MTARQGSACQLPTTAACRCMSPPQAALPVPALASSRAPHCIFTPVSECDLPPFLPPAWAAFPRLATGSEPSPITSSSVQGPSHLCFDSPDSPEPCLEASGATEPRAVLEWGPLPEAVFQLPPQGALWVTHRPSFSPAPPVFTLHPIIVFSNLSLLSSELMTLFASFANDSAPGDGARDGPPGARARWRFLNRLQAETTVASSCFHDTHFSCPYWGFLLSSSQHVSRGRSGGGMGELVPNAQSARLTAFPRLTQLMLTRATLFFQTFYFEVRLTEKFWK